MAFIFQEMNHMDLKDLGWKDFFQEQMDSLELEGVFPGRVARTGPGILGLLTEEGEIEARVSGRLKQKSVSSSELPGIGDWVLYKPLETGNMVFLVLERTSKISRKVPGKGLEEQLIAANVDLIFVVMGLDDDFNLRRLERYLTMISGSGASPAVLLNKSDLVNEDDKRVLEAEEICGEVPLIKISALGKKGLDAVEDLIQKGRTISLVGSSGAGKSTLINSLIGNQVQRTGEVREDDSKGRHVTTSRELFLLPGGGLIIDNPGMRELQLWGDTTSLESAFPEIAELSPNCRFRDCRHESEPGCAVRMALENRELDENRYHSYQKLRRELEVLSIKSDIGSEAMKKKKWKNIKKGIKGYYKFKKEGR